MYWRHTLTSAFETCCTDIVLFVYTHCQPFCFNTFDGSGDANDASVCANLVLQDASGAAIDEWPMFIDQVWARILKC